MNAIKFFLLICFLLFGGVLPITPSWSAIPQALQYFYTDQTPLYLQLHPQGFRQRFRVQKKFCQQIKKASLILLAQHGDFLQEHSFKKSGESTSSSWPHPYGIEKENYCWFEVLVNGLNLNSNILYTIKTSLQSDSSYYFLDESSSLLPAKRWTIKSSDLIKKANSLGALGASPVKGGGVFFKVWEPTASSVHLFLGPSGIEKKYVLNRHDINKNVQEPLKSKIFHIKYVPEAQINDKYYFRFVKENQYESLEVLNNKFYSDIKIDPLATAITFKKKGGKINGYLEPKGVIKDLYDDSLWNDHDFLKSFSQDHWNNWIIYQIWPLTFNPQKNDQQYVAGTYQDIQQKVSYLQQLGINAVEFLPLQTNRFYGSWGYALDHLLALQNSYGESQELKKLINSLHQKNIRVIFDVVINHINNDLMRDPLSKTILHTKFYKGNTPWGAKPDFENPWVRKIIKDSLIIQMQAYHVDGFRFDMAGYIYGYSLAGYQYLQELNQLFKMINPTFYTSAEELPDNVWATYPISDNGLAFDAQWNNPFKNFFEEKLDHYRPHHRQADLTLLKMSLEGLSDHKKDDISFYPFGHPLRTVNYLSSHDFVGNRNPILRIVSDYHSLEKSGHNTFFQVRPIEDPQLTPKKFELIHNDFTHQVARLSYSILFTKPGAILFFQGEELGNDINIENEWSYINAKKNNSIPSVNVPLSRYIGSHRTPWEYLNPQTDPEVKAYISDSMAKLFKGHHQLFSDLISWRQHNPQINHQEAKIIEYNPQKSLITYTVGNHLNENSSYFIVTNWGYDLRNHPVLFPASPKNHPWKLVFHSNDKKYGGKMTVSAQTSYDANGNIPMDIMATSFMMFCTKCKGSF